jgi:dihydrofolate reductase
MAADSNPMTSIQLYIAHTLDGFIARPDGSLDWLESLPNPDGTDYGYHHFLSEVDTVIMGRKTYETVLGFGVEWPYAHKDTWVVTAQQHLPTPTPRTQLLHRVDEEAIRNLRAASQQNIWLVGGGEVIRTFMALDALDELILCVIPVTIGEGVPLFPEVKETSWELLSPTPYASGAVILHYRKRK